MTILYGWIIGTLIESALGVDIGYFIVKHWKL